MCERTEKIEVYFNLVRTRGCFWRERRDLFRIKLRVFITRNRRTPFFVHAVPVAVIIKLKLESGRDSSHELFNRVERCTAVVGSGDEIRAPTHSNGCQ